MSTRHIIYVAPRLTIELNVNSSEFAFGVKTPELSFSSTQMLPIKDLQMLLDRIKEIVSHYTD